MYKSYLIVVLAAMFSACGANQDKEALQEEDREAKEKLQGIWLDDNRRDLLDAAAERIGSVQ